MGDCTVIDVQREALFINIVRKWGGFNPLTGREACKESCSEQDNASTD